MRQVPKLDSLTGLRGIAAFAVVGWHSISAFPQYEVTRFIFELGFLAVPFFFCLSGFVMHWSYEHTPRPLFEFLIRRIARIYPVALTGFAISIMSFWYFGNPLAGYVGGRHSIPLSILLMQSWAYDSPDICQSWDGVSWSLSCEMFFYLVSPVMLPFIKMATGSRAIIALTFTLGSYFFVRFLAHGILSENFLLFAPIARLPEYLCGALVAKILLNGQGLKTNLKILAIFVLLPIPIFLSLGIALDTYLATGNTISRLMLASFLLLIFAVAKRDLQNTFAPPLNVLRSHTLVFVGEISYSLYMMHALVLGAFSFGLGLLQFRIASSHTGEAVTIFYIVTALLVSTAVYYGVERPAYRGVLYLWKTKANSSLAERKLDQYFSKQ
jgi:peptidoglycan/LPS O-acetylase OafA/YrhL